MLESSKQSNRLISWAALPQASDLRSALCILQVGKISALRGNRTPGGSMATTQVTTTPLMLIEGAFQVDSVCIDR